MKKKELINKIKESSNIVARNISNRTVSLEVDGVYKVYKSYDGYDGNYYTDYIRNKDAKDVWEAAADRYIELTYKRKNNEN